MKQRQAEKLMKLRRQGFNLRMTHKRSTIIAVDRAEARCRRFVERLRLFRSALRLTALYSLTVSDDLRKFSRQIQKGNFQKVKFHHFLGGPVNHQTQLQNHLIQDEVHIDYSALEKRLAEHYEKGANQAFFATNCPIPGNINTGRKEAT